MRTEKYIILIIGLLYASLAHASLTFRGLNQPAIEVTTAASSGLESVYVLPWTNNVQAVYSSTSSDGSSVTVSKYSSMGGGYAEEVHITIDDASVMWTLNDGDMGYIVRDHDRMTCYWVVDYSRHRMSLNGVNISAESDCGMTLLDVTGEAGRITYYSINGAPMTLSRDIIIRYNTLEWNSDTKMYTMKAVEEKSEYISGAVHVVSPLTNTRFSIRGDRFMDAWGEAVEVSTGEYTATAVTAETEAKQTARENDNEQSAGDGDSLGGSAPCDVEFTAYISDAVVFKEWQISTYSDFSDIYRRYNESVLNYTFTDAGQWYVRFMASDASGKCEYYSDSYTVNIGESALLCPNAFSPGVTEGINDEWKVSYKSIVEFECHIFNRWGQQLAEFTDPSVGWDGKYNGKFVPAGVYYYVIKATGADGRKYNVSGDINIIGYRENNNN